jgi:hypothetical protein
MGMGIPSFQYLINFLAFNAGIMSCYTKYVYCRKTIGQHQEGDMLDE